MSTAISSNALHAKFNPLIRRYLGQPAALRGIERRMDEIIALLKERK